MSPTSTTPDELSAEPERGVAGHESGAVGSAASESEGVKREEFVTARQLAAFLQVSESTVRRLAREGLIPSVRLTPRLVRFNLEAVCDALNRQASRPSEHQRAPLTGLSRRMSDGAVERARRRKLVAGIDELRRRISAKYGELPDSTHLVREDRAR